MGLQLIDDSLLEQRGFRVTGEDDERRYYFRQWNGKQYVKLVYYRQFDNYGVIFRTTRILGLAFIDQVDDALEMLRRWGLLDAPTKLW